MALAQLVKDEISISDDQGLLISCIERGLNCFEFDNYIEVPFTKVNPPWLINKLSHFLVTKKCKGSFYIDEGIDLEL